MRGGDAQSEKLCSVRKVLLSQEGYAQSGRLPLSQEGGLAPAWIRINSSSGRKPPFLTEQFFRTEYHVSHEH